MAPTETEIFIISPPEGHRKLPTLRPGDPPGSFSDLQPDDSIHIYGVECAPDDSSTTIWRATKGISVEGHIMRGLLTTKSGREKVATLHQGESHEFPITSRSGKKALVRVTHK